MVKKYCRLILFIAAVALAVIYFPAAWKLFKFFLSAMKPVFIAVFLALIFHIPINFLSAKVFKFIKKEKLRYALSLIVVYVMVFGLLAAGIYFLAPEVIESFKGFIEKLPEYGAELKEKLLNLLSGFGVTEAKLDEMLEELKRGIIGAAGGINGMLTKVKEIGKGALTLFFAVVLSVYILFDRKRLIRQIKQFTTAILPDKASKVLNNTATVGGVIFAKFLGGQFIEALLLGVVTFLGMLAIGLPYAPLVSVVVFAANLIPMLGAYIGGVVGFVLIAFVSVKQAVIFVIFTIVLQQLENNITYPKVVGNSLGLSGFWVMASVLVGGALFGFWGILLGVPAVAVIYKMLGFRLKKDKTSGALIPEMLKESNKPGGADRAEKGSGESDRDGGA